MTMPGDHSEELVELVTRALWARCNGRRLRADEPAPARGTMYWFEAIAVLDALSSSGWLVPEGSEVREEWIAVIDDDLALDARDEARAHRIVELEGGHVESRKVITTPWSPSVPDTKERDDA